MKPDLTDRDISSLPVSEVTQFCDQHLALNRRVSRSQLTSSGLARDRRTWQPSTRQMRAGTWANASCKSSSTSQKAPGNKDWPSSLLPQHTFLIHQGSHPGGELGHAGKKERRAVEWALPASRSTEAESRGGLCSLTHFFGMPWNLETLE